MTRDLIMPRKAKIKPTIVLAAGGTGGHVFPAVALSDALKPMGYERVFVTDKRGDAQDEQFGINTIPVHTLSAGSPSGKNPIKIALAVCKLFKGYLQARKLYKTINPSVVVGFGGYPSVPALIAAQHMGIKTIIHDQNAVFGRANRLIAGGADVLATSFPEISKLSPSAQAKIIYTGNPVRPAIAKLHERDKKIFGKNSPINVLVTGGSQGAKILGEIVPKAIANMDKRLQSRLRIIQQVRAEQVPIVQNQYNKIGVNAHVMSFVTDMPKKLRDTHVAICRAGGSTVAEMTCAGIPTIYIPLPSAVDNHQTHNTDHVVKHGGGWLQPQATLRPTTLADKLSGVLRDPTVIETASARAGECASPDAHKKLATIVDNLVKYNNPHGKTETSKTTETPPEQTQQDQ